jgi:hypothetical protein
MERVRRAGRAHEEGWSSGLRKLVGAVDCDGSANSPIDQVSIDKANVPLEDLAAALDQPIPDVGDGGGGPCHHPHDLATPQVPKRARLDANVALGGEDGLLLLGNEEVGTEAVVLHQESLAARQPAEELHDGPVLPDPVGRLEYEPGVHRTPVSWMRASLAQLDTIQIGQDSSPSPWPSSGGDPISSGWSETASHRRVDRPEPVE